MLIDLSKFLSVADKNDIVHADIEMNRFKTKVADYKITEKKPMVISLCNIGKRKVSFSSDIELSLMIPCDRCLEPVKYDMNIKVNKEIDMNQSQNERVESMDSMDYIQDNSIDIEKLVYNEILVHLPMKVLCSENCKGICNRCGANLNSQTCNCDTIELDPRMSKIRDIFNNFKEV